MDSDFEQMADRIDQNMTFTSLDLFATSIPTPVWAGQKRLMHRFWVTTCCRRVNTKFGSKKTTAIRCWRSRHSL